MIPAVPKNDSRLANKMVIKMSLRRWSHVVLLTNFASISRRFGYSRSMSVRSARIALFSSLIRSSIVSLFDAEVPPDPCGELLIPSLLTGEYL
jgi:hypothetical protein